MLNFAFYSLMGYLLFGLFSERSEAALTAISDNHSLCKKGELDNFQHQLLEEVNLARTNPRKYAAIVAEKFTSLGANKIYINDGIQYVTQEGHVAVNDAIAFLKAARPVTPLKMSNCLSIAAKQHVDDQGPQGGRGHLGSDGSKPSDRAKRYVVGSMPYCGENISYGPKTARDVVVQLLVDDGVPGRGHRKNLFEPGYQSVGVAFGRHKTYGYMSVQLLCLNPLQN